MNKKYFLFLTLFLLISCAGSVHKTTDVLLEESPSKKPAWVDKTIVPAGNYIFAIGHSKEKENERGAKDDALIRATEEVVRYCGVTVDTFDRSIESYAQTQDKIYHKLDFQSRADIRAKAFVKNAIPEQWYIRKMAKMQGNRKLYEFYIASVYLRVPKDAVERIKEDKDIKISLDLGIYYEDENGKLQYLTEGSVLHSGDAYAIYVKPSDDCYVYVYQVDDIGKSYKLFPNDNFNTGYNPLLAGQDYWIPNTDQFLVLDETTGKEKFYIFASLQKINDLEGSLTLEEKDFGRVLKTMGVGGLRQKTNPGEVVTPRKTQEVAEVKKKLQAEGAFVYETWFWHK